MDSGHSAVTMDLRLVRRFWTRLKQTSKERALSLVIKEWDKRRRFAVFEWVESEMIQKRLEWRKWRTNSRREAR
jgi:hypothetical protein